MRAAQEDFLREAERYAKAAVEADRYNARALVNRGACKYQRGWIAGGSTGAGRAAATALPRQQ